MSPVKLLRLALRETWHQLRWALPVWALWLATTWWPNNRLTIRLRGALHRPFFRRCGRNFQMAAGVRLLNTHRMEIGSDVYVAYDVWLNGLGGLTLEDEVVLGPFVTISTLNHCCRDGSFRFGGASSAPVRIGRGSWLAAHVSVAAGVSVGTGCLVAANAAVAHDVPDGSMAGGVPAKVLGPVREVAPMLFSRLDQGDAP
jgi:acetyltransferase-like isoleucine patch superfamily enzyme